MAIKEYSDFGSDVSYEERMAAAIREIDTGYDAIRAGGNLSFSAGTIFRKAVEYIAFGQIEASGFTLADVHFWDSAKERKVFHMFSRPGYAQMVTFLSELHLVGEDELEYYEVVRSIGNEATHASVGNVSTLSLGAIRKAGAAANALYKIAMGKDTAKMRQDALEARQRVYADCLVNSLSTERVEKFSDADELLPLYAELRSVYREKLLAEGVSSDCARLIKEAFENSFESALNKLDSNSGHIDRWFGQIEDKDGFIERHCDDVRYADKVFEAENEKNELERKTEDVRCEIGELVESLKPKLNEMDALLGEDSTSWLRDRISRAAYRHSRKLAVEIDPTGYFATTGEAASASSTTAASYETGRPKPRKPVGPKSSVPAGYTEEEWKKAKAAYQKRLSSNLEADSARFLLVALGIIVLVTFLLTGMASCLVRL